MLAAVVATAVAAGARAGVTPSDAPVTAAGGSLAFQDPTLAVDPTDHARLAMAYYEFSTGRQCMLALSSDSGRTWSTKVVVGDGGPIPLTGEQVKCYSPKIAYGPAGVLYYMYQAARAPGSMPREVLIAVSHDGGVTFGSPAMLDSSTNRIVYQQVALAVDETDGRVYAAWTHYIDSSNQQVMLAFSRDQGQTFAPGGALPVSETSPGTDEASLVVDRDHTLHVGWRTFAAGPPFEVQKFAATSKDGGQTFGPASLVLTDLDQGCGGAACQRPVEYAADNVSAELARGSSPGQLFAVGWGPEGNVATNNRRIVFSSSSDGGATWQPQKTIGIPPGHEADDQARPELTVTPTGRIEIVYQDISAVPGGSQSIFEIHSDDGGSTFSAPAQLNSAPSDVRIGPASFSTFNGGSTATLGAHPAVAFSDGEVFAAWTDTRRGTLDAPKQDIFFAALPLPPLQPRLSLSVHRHDSGARTFRHRATSLTIGGRLLPPAGEPASACQGAVSVEIQHGSRAISRHELALRADCSYREKVVVPSSRLHGRARNSVLAEFHGNALLKPASARNRFR